MKKKKCIHVDSSTEVWLDNRISYCISDIAHRKAELRALKNIDDIITKYKNENA